MLKRDITYTDFNDQTVTETFYFNMTKAELVDLETSVEGGMEQRLRKIIEAEDRNQLIALFKQILLLTYGVRSEDGKRFIKSDQLREEFTQTAAYDALFVELASDDEAAAQFIMAVLPKDISQSIADPTKPMPEPPSATPAVMPPPPGA